MIETVNRFLSGWRMTLVGGAALLASFLLPRAGLVWGEHLAWICVAICGLPLLYLAVRRLLCNRGIARISSALLISMAMIAAICIGDLFAAGEVAFIMQIGALLEDMTTDRAQKGLKNLISLTPDTGRVLRDGTPTVVPVAEIKKGDVLRILPGETVPVDGRILAGETSVDQSVMTGESLPVDKTVGDTVFSGTLNCFGSIDMEATNVGEDSSLQKLIALVSDARNHQAPTQRIADRWASWLVPVALLIAVFAGLITRDIVRAVTVLVVFCPCALVLATPTAIMAAIGQATKHGVIIKSGEALERMGTVDTVAFDKTGTLTLGTLRVSDVIPLGGLSEDALLALAAAAERRSEHPLGRAVYAQAVAAGLPIPDADEFRMEPGRGVSARIDGKVYYFGNEAYLRGVEADAAVLSHLRAEGKALILASDGTDLLGVLALSDTVRPEAAEVVRRLREMNLRPVLLTGDHRAAAAHLAAQVGIPELRADLLPGEKIDAIGQLGRSGCVCMVGDGVNDAPALKAASVGVAMGAMGSDIAVDASDIALMDDSLSRLPYLKWLGNTTRRTIRCAIALSMCINLAAVTLSVLGILTPTTGALVHNAGSCLVVLLAALLYDRKYPER